MSLGKITDVNSFFFPPFEKYRHLCGKKCIKSRQLSFISNMLLRAFGISLGKISVTDISTSAPHRDQSIPKGNLHKYAPLMVYSGTKLTLTNLRQACTPLSQVDHSSLTTLLCICCSNHVRKSVCSH